LKLTFGFFQKCTLKRCIFYLAAAGFQKKKCSDILPAGLELQARNTTTEKEKMVERQIIAAYPSAGM